MIRRHLFAVTESGRRILLTEQANGERRTEYEYREEGGK